MALSRLHIDGEWFRDEEGRRHILRGVNLGGDCKVPWPEGATNVPTDFADHRTVSFIGRPFPLDEAETHFARLKGWGFNCLRLLTTWEAVEHAGPGIYDEAYLDYYAELVRLAGEHGMYVFVDFHQDVWSRMTGGDGAPGWVFEAVGLDFKKFHTAGAAHVMQAKYDFARGGRQEERYATMTWAQNYRYPANGIMWTLFFAGKTFCPDFMIGTQNVQDYLQDHYIGAMKALGERLKGFANVIGFDTLNEPGSGYVGERMSYRHVGPSECNKAPARPGIAWSPFDGLAVARGVTRVLPSFIMDRTAWRVAQVSDEVVNPDGVSIWLPGASCPFEQAGAYALKNGEIYVRDEYFFLERGGHIFEIETDFMVPFFQRVEKGIRSINPDWLIFAELDPQKGLTHGFPDGTPSRTVNASHWYDIVTLSTKEFNYPRWFNPYSGRSVEGADAIERMYENQLRRIKGAALTLNGGKGAPTLIGEFGIPFDLEGGAAYEAFAEGDHGDAPWHAHITALDLMYNAMDRLLLHSTQWNYTASNRNDLAVGDGWNQEDLSIFSENQRNDPQNLDSGGRALAGFVRPYARSITGRPLEMLFNRTSGLFHFVYEADGEGDTEIFVPTLQYPEGFAFEIDGGDLFNTPDAQIVRIHASGAGTVIVTLMRP